MDNDPVTRLLDLMAAGTGIPQDLYTDGAVLDATVPMWRFEKHGPAEIAAQLSRWYDRPGTLLEAHRWPVPGGEALRILLELAGENGPQLTHQAHFLVTEGDRIARHEAWCGGRWDAALQARMEVDLQLARGAS